MRVGLVGYGVCQFGAAFGFQNHPNVEVVAVSDLIPERCAELAKACRCEKTYPSLEEMVKDDRNRGGVRRHRRAEPCAALHRGSQARQARGRTVPAVFGSSEDADQLYEAVKSTGLKYMMFETSCFHEDIYAMRQIYNAGGFGKMVYTEGEYFHYMDTPIDSYKGWRVACRPNGIPRTPTPTTSASPAEASPRSPAWACQPDPHLQPANNPYDNPFGTEIALFRTSEGGMASMAVSWDTPGPGGEMGRGRGQKGSILTWPMTAGATCRESL